MGQSIKFYVSSDTPGMGIQNLELEVDPRQLGTSWHALLVRHQEVSQMDVDTMMIRSSGRKIMTALDEPIRHFVKQFKKKGVTTYRVQIVKTKANSETRKKLEARRIRCQFQRDPEGMSSSQSETAAPPPTPAPKRVGRIRTPGGRRSGEHSGAGAEAAGQNKVMSNLPGPSIYTEDAINYPPSLPPGDEENNVNMQDEDYNASQCSQDSQDPGVDLKSGALERFQKFVKDGDIIRINGELEKLSEEKWVKFSRDISYTLTQLRMIFRPKLDH